MDTHDVQLDAPAIKVENYQVPVVICDSHGTILSKNDLFDRYFQDFERPAATIFDFLTQKPGEASVPPQAFDLDSRESDFLLFTAKQGKDKKSVLGMHYFPLGKKDDNQTKYLCLFFEFPHMPTQYPTEARYLHYLKTINKISGHIHTFENEKTLSDFVVKALHFEEYNYFHVGVFLRNPELANEFVDLIALEGDSRVHFQEGYSQSINEGVIGEVIRTGKPKIINDAAADPLYLSYGMFRAKSEICVPILLMNQVIGAINIESKNQTTFDEADVAFLESVADLFAASVYRLKTYSEIQNKNKILRQTLKDLSSAKKNLENKSEELMKVLRREQEIRSELERRNKIMQDELNMAAELQNSLLPRKMPQIEGFHFDSYYQPTSQLGGDIFDIVQITEDYLGIIIADVSGHGVSAAIIASMFKALFTRYHQQSRSPAMVLKSINLEMTSILTRGEFLTAFYMIIHLPTRKAVYANAGHPFPLLLHQPDQGIEELDTKGFFLGVFADTQYFEKEKQLVGGDKLLFYTDGLIEVRSRDSDIYGRERLKEFFLQKQILDSGRDEFIADLMKNVVLFKQNQPFEDDITLVFMEID